MTPAKSSKRSTLAASSPTAPLTTQKSFYVEISRARDRAELVTDDAAGLKAQLQAATGERIAALEAIGEAAREAKEKAAGAARSYERQPGRDGGAGAGTDREKPASPSKDAEMTGPERGRGRDKGLGL